MLNRANKISGLTKRPVPRRPLLIATMAIAVMGVGVAIPKHTATESGQTDESVRQEVETALEPLALDVVQPTPGGLPRSVTQTGTIEPWESVDLHARISGCLATIDVEIGDIVEAGQLLATLDAVELQKDVEKAAAQLLQAESRVTQAEARLETERAEQKAARGLVQQKLADIARAQAQSSLRGKQFSRLQGLIAQGAVELTLADEKLREVEVARAEMNAAEAGRSVAEAACQAIESRIRLASADIAAAKADVQVAAAALERARVLDSYSRIVAPFSGVVTSRGFDRGDFVQAASSHSQPAVITVARTDRMRAVLRVPAADAPFVGVGQPAVVEIGSLGGLAFEGVVSRFSHRLDKRTRTMRAEVDLDNESQQLAEGMYGSIAIAVPPGSEQLTIPQNCLTERVVNGRGCVWVLKDGRLQRRCLAVGRSGSGRAEVLAGLEESELVVVPDGSEVAMLQDGLPATARASEPATGDGTVASLR